LSNIENIILRSATIADLPLLLDWETQPHVKAGVPEDDDWNWEYELPRNPHWREMLIAEINNQPLGFIQIINAAHEETHYWGAVPDDLMAIDIWIGPAKFLGKGYGTKMMNLAIQRCFANKKINGILIDPLETNTKVHRFYERLGFEFLEKRNLEGEDCLIYILRRDHQK